MKTEDRHEFLTQIMLNTPTKLSDNVLWLYLVAENTRLSSNLKIMKTNTKSTENTAECGNKSKPLLGEVYWTIDITYSPVQVEILELDIENRMARINQGWISYDRLYESEDKCTQR